MVAVRRADIQEYLKISPPRYYDLALLYATVGERDKSIEFLQKAYADHDGSMVFLAIANELDPVRSDPRFKELLQKMRLPELG